MNIQTILKLIQQLVSNQINKIYFNNKISYSFAYIYVLSYLNIDVSDSSSIVQFSYGIFLISLIGLFSLFNIIGFMITYIILKEKMIEDKYPKLSIIINYYKSTRIFFLIIQIIICLICFLLLTCFSLIIIYSETVN